MGKSLRKVTGDEIRSWREYAATRSGKTDGEIAAEIKAMGSRFARTTIWRYLRDENRERANSSSREYHRRVYAQDKAIRLKKQRRLERIRERSIVMRQEHGDEVRRYGRNYGRLRRPSAQQSILAKLHADHPDTTWTLDSLTEAIKPYVDNVAFQPETVQKRLTKPYAEHCRGPPYLVREGDKYVLRSETLFD